MTAAASAFGAYLTRPDLRVSLKMVFEITRKTEVPIDCENERREIAVEISDGFRAAWTASRG